MVFRGSLSIHNSRNLQVNTEKILKKFTFASTKLRQKASFLEILFMNSGEKHAISRNCEVEISCGP